MTFASPFEHLRKAALTALSLLLVLAPAAQAVADQTVLKGRIIRSLSVDTDDPDHILVGQKGAEPGSALVFESRDGGNTWKSLNGGKPLSAQASDVQAVVRVDDTVILAGTWKQGLYASRDGGARFIRLSDFPSTDIRDLQVVKQSNIAVVYAATARDGIFRSDDAGVTWQALGPGPDFFWSLTVSAAGEALYAVSLEQAVYRGDGKGSWEMIFDAQNAFALAVTENGRTLAIAADAGVFLSDDAGKSWRVLEALKGEKFADAHFLADDGGALLLASWSNGVVAVDPATGTPQRYLPGVAVVHLQAAQNRLLAGTWGDGLKILPLSDLNR